MISILCLAVVVLGACASLFLGVSGSYDPQIFWILRLPRTLLGIAVGGGLSVAGAVVQGSLGNPLAEPFTLGIASAASLGAVVGSVFIRGKTLVIPGVITFAGSTLLAFGFATGVTLGLVVWLRKSFRSSTDILLTGVISGLFFSSLATLFLALADPASWSTSMGWLLGSLGNPSLIVSCSALTLMILASLLAWLHWKPLDLMATDELMAAAAGVHIARYRKRLFFLVAFITALSVAAAGIIGFVGLVVPHALRFLGVRSHKVLLPCAFLTGAGLLLIADVLARFAVQPSEIPVGVVTALIGAPVFLVLARRRASS